LESAQHHHFSRKQQRARPVSGRPRVDTRGNYHRKQEITMTDTNTKLGRLAAAIHAMDPERSSLRRLGNGLLIRAQEVQLLPGPPTIPSLTHD
jgi:hypothetical protein